jgi:aromatic ring-opening dioxygenase catalytic subunit (LigB family)
MITKAFYPALFVNHGGGKNFLVPSLMLLCNCSVVLNTAFESGPLPILGRQEAIAKHLKEVVQKLVTPPKAIVVISAHWESDPVRITSSANPGMYFDYYGFPPETYEYKYPAPGDPDLASRIKGYLQQHGVKSELDSKRGFDHGVFVPLMLMFPKVGLTFAVQS